MGHRSFLFSGKLGHPPRKSVSEVKNKSNSGAVVGRGDSHVWPKAGQTWGTDLFCLVESWATRLIGDLEQHLRYIICVGPSLRSG